MTTLYVLDVPENTGVARDSRVTQHDKDALRVEPA